MSEPGATDRARQLATQRKQIEDELVAADTNFERIGLRARLLALDNEARADWEAYVSLTDLYHANDETQARLLARH